MAVWSLVAFSLLFMILNYMISHGDFFNPAVLFSAINFINCIIVAYVKEYYRIEFVWDTVTVLVIGQLIFTLFNIVLFLKRKAHISQTKYNCVYIKVQSFWVVCYILIELVVIYEMYKHMRNIVSYLGVSGSLATIIGGFNSAIKFNSDELSAAGISGSALLAYGKPVVNGIGLFLMTIEVNNYYATKKHNRLVVFSILLVFFLALMGGSRGDAFRFLTALLCMIILLKRKIQGSIKKGNTKLMARIGIGAILFVVLIVNTRGYFGRTVDNSLPFWRPVFPYIGAPVANLNHFINNGTGFQSSVLFGQETFCNLYKYIGMRLHKGAYIYNLNLPFLYQNGINTGNVYTMYYMFLEDFGFGGIIPLVSIIAYYYLHRYKKEMTFGPRNGIIKFGTILYSYMFNSLIMLLFSNRFYEDMLSTSSFRMYLTLFIVLYLHRTGFFQRKIKFMR